MTTVVVREYARLTTDKVTQSLEQATVSPSAFEWLCNLSGSFRQSGASLLQIENTRWLKLDSFVGVVETPCGTLLEILPKHTEDTSEASAIESRQLLMKMLEVALDLPVRSTDKTDIQTFKHPLLEWVMKQFVVSLDQLIKRGLRFDYQRVEEKQRFLRGQLDLVKQMRQPPGRDHVFNIRHDLFLPDRPENRLLKSALMHVCKATQQPDTWRLSHELAGMLAEIPDSKDIANDFRQWRHERLMAHYQPVRPWCELVLGQHMPLALRGHTHGTSLLFPMEKLFERYVEVKLRQQLPAPYTLKSQAASQSLCQHEGNDIFQLKPDLLIMHGKQTRMVLDTKWKLISANDRQNKYGLSQNDFYQMFAYGHKYLAGQGEMALIYPCTSKFDKALPLFEYHNETEFSSGLRLWVIPFDLKADKICWPADWNTNPFFQYQQVG